MEGVCWRGSKVILQSEMQILLDFMARFRRVVIYVLSTN